MIAAARELAGTADVSPEKHGRLPRVACDLTAALDRHPHDPDAWIRASPRVDRPGRGPASLPEMLLTYDGGDPQRTARLLIRALDWELPG